MVIFHSYVSLPEAIQSVGAYFPIPTSHPVASTGASGVQEPQTTLLGGSVPSGGKGVFVAYN